MGMSSQVCLAAWMPRLRVTADGKLKSCLHSREEISLKGLRGHGLEEALRQGILQKPREHHLSRPGLWRCGG